MASLRTLDNALTASMFVLALFVNGFVLRLVSYAEGQVVSSFGEAVEALKRIDSRTERIDLKFSPAAIKMIQEEVRDAN